MITAHPEIAGFTDWRPLARGGFATVWQARQETLNRLVAVKVDQRTLDSDKEQRRFLREAGAAGRMSGHPGIVTVHDAGILTDGRPYLVMELCPGGSLTKWLKGGNRPTQEQVRDVGVRIADALADAHSRGVLHRDVKPANIMVDAYGNPGLADFGLAAMPQPGQDLSVTMEALTPAYAPKEVLHQKPPSEYGDVFSLAATMYALLDGKPPRWPEEGTPSLPEIFELQSKPVERLDGVHPDLMDVLLRALADDAEERPTAAEFRDQLKAIDFAEEPSVAAPAAVPPPPVERRRRSRVPLLIGLVALLLVGGLVAGMALGNRQPTAVDPPVPVSPSTTPTTEPTSSPAPTPTPTPTPTGEPVPLGFVDCSELLGEGALCPTEPECWNQYFSYTGLPASAIPVTCDESHTNQTIAAIRIDFRVRLQAQLDENPELKRFCSYQNARKIMLDPRARRAWSYDLAPPQIGEDDRLVRCLVAMTRTGPVALRTSR